MTTVNMATAAKMLKGRTKTITLPSNGLDVEIRKVSAMELFEAGVVPGLDVEALMQGTVVVNEDDITAADATKFLHTILQMGVVTFNIAIESGASDPNTNTLSIHDLDPDDLTFMLNKCTEFSDIDPASVGALQFRFRRINGDDNSSAGAGVQHGPDDGSAVESPDATDESAGVHDRSSE